MPTTIHSPSSPVPAADRSLALKAAASVLFVAVVGLSWVLGHGPAGPGYLVLYALLLLPGLPIGFLLFGREHAAGWIAGALIGYGLSAIVLWIPVDLGFTGHVWAPTAWAALTVSTHLVTRGSQVVVVLPQWHRGDTAALLCAPSRRTAARCRAVLARRRAGSGGQPPIPRLFHGRLPLARGPDRRAREGGPSDSQPLSRAPSAQLLLGVLRAAGDDRQKCRGRAFARGLLAAQRALRRAAVRCLHLSLRLVCGSPGRPGC